MWEDFGLLREEFVAHHIDDGEVADFNHRSLATRYRPDMGLKEEDG